DSAAVENSANTAGSRSALEVGNAVAGAARRARQHLLERAQATLEAAPVDLVASPSGVEVRGAPGRRVALSELLDQTGLLEEQDTFQSSGAYTSAVHALVLELNAELATVEVVSYTIAHDCGQPINPMLVNGQLQ